MPGRAARPLPWQLAGAFIRDSAHAFSSRDTFFLERSPLPWLQFQTQTPGQGPREGNRGQRGTLSWPQGVWVQAMDGQRQAASPGQGQQGHRNPSPRQHPGLTLCLPDFMLWSHQPSEGRAPKPRERQGPNSSAPPLKLCRAGLQMPCTGQVVPNSPRPIQKHFPKGKTRPKCRDTQDPSLSPRGRESHQIYPCPQGSAGPAGGLLDWVTAVHARPGCSTADLVLPFSLSLSLPPFSPSLLSRETLP